MRVLACRGRCSGSIIDVAYADPVWQAMKASWALSGIELTSDNARQAGRMVVGDITCELLVSELRAKYAR
jgi:hypothetical protein